MFPRRIAVTAASGLMALGALAGLGAVPASAEVSQHALKAHTAVGGSDPCSGDLCAQIYSISPNGSDIQIEAWAELQTFYGHFELQTPNHKTYNSKNNTNKAGGIGHIFTVPYGGGLYAITAWATSGSGGYNKIGYVTINI